MKVSVLLPCHNSEAFIEDALQSVLNQTLENIEVIVVDDGSTDRSPEIIAKIAKDDPRVIVLTQNNGGIVSALNAGLSLCSSEYIARMDADDISLPNRLKVQSDYLDENPGVAIVGAYTSSDWENIHNTNEVTTGGRHKETDLTTYPPKIAVAMHPVIMVRRSVLEAIGGYHADYKHAEDYDLFIRVSDHGKVENIEQVLLYYRRHEGAISIRHVDQQERSAVLAEHDALERKGLPLPPRYAREVYTRFRIWRRYLNVDPVKAKTLRRRLWWDILSLPFYVVRDARLARLNAILAFSVLRSLKS